MHPAIIPVLARLRQDVAQILTPQGAPTDSGGQLGDVQ